MLRSANVANRNVSTVSFWRAVQMDGRELKLKATQNTKSGMSELLVTYDIVARSLFAHPRARR